MHGPAAQKILDSPIPGGQRKRMVSPPSSAIFTGIQLRMRVPHRRSLRQPHTQHLNRLALTANSGSTNFLRN